MPFSIIAGLGATRTVDQRDSKRPERVVDEARLALGGQSRARHPAEQAEELAAVADPEGEGVGPVVEGLEHLLQPVD